MKCTRAATYEALLLLVAVRAWDHIQVGVVHLAVQEDDWNGAVALEVQGEQIRSHILGRHTQHQHIRHLERRSRHRGRKGPAHNLQEKGHPARG